MMMVYGVDTDLSSTCYVIITGVAVLCRGMRTYKGHIYVCVYPQGDTRPATLLATRLYPHTSYFITHCTDVLPLEFCEMPLFAV